MAGDVAIKAKSDLQQRVRTVARRARGLVRLYAVSWFLATVILALVVLGLIDYLVRFEDVGVRLICFALVWGVVAWGAYRYLLTAWRYRISELQAAQRIERCYPGLGDLLSSAVAFSSQLATDEKSGSLELRRTVIAQAEVATEPLDFATCLDRRQSLRALVLALLAVAIVLTLGWANGPAAALAAKRLFVPWSAEHWPRRHVLEFVAPPTRLAAGQDFEVELVDANGQLPDQVQIHYWFDGDDASAIETHAMQPLGQKLTHRLDDVTRSFLYRATGGDDQNMAWHELQVVEPAHIVAHDMMLTPPAYSGLAARPATGGFRTLRGTRVALHLRVDKPLSSAALETDTTSGPQTIPLQLDADRLGCRLAATADDAWEVNSSGSYGFRLVDRDGVDNGAQERWEVEAITDAPPTVMLRQPAGDLFLTPQASVMIEAIVKDDLAIRAVSLQFTRSGSPDGGPQTVALWSGPEQVTPESDSAAVEDKEGVERTVRYEWNLSSLPDLQPATEIEFRVVASDYLGQEGPSAGRRITILSAEEHEERVVQRQAEILAQIAEVARLQRQTRGQTTQLAIPLREVGTLSREEVDQLQGAELNQRQVQQRLGHPSDGLQSQVAELIRDIKGNGQDNPPALGQLQSLHDGIRALNENALPKIEHHMIDALKLAREELRTRSENPGAEPAAREPLQQLVGDVAATQDEVVRALEQMLGQLSQWDSYRRLATEVGRFRREEAELRQRTELLRQETFSKDLRDLTDPQRVSLYRMAEQQNDIALRFDALENRMSATRRELAADDPQAAAALDDAMTMARRAGVGADMRDAAHEMENNRLSQATQQQDEVLQWLGELQDILAHRRQDTQAYERHERLGQLFQSVTALLNRQQQLGAETRQTDQPAAPDGAVPPDKDATIQRLTNQQQAIGHDLNALQQTVTDLESFAMALGDAGNAAVQAAQNMQQKNIGADTQRHQQEVADILNRLLTALREEQPPPQQPDESQNDPNAPQQDEPTSDGEFVLAQLKMIRGMQQELNRDTAALDSEAHDADGWNDSRIAKQRQLTDKQGALATILQQLQGKKSGQNPGATPHPADDHLDQLERTLDKDQKDKTIDQQLLEDLPNGTPPDSSVPKPDVNGGQTFGNSGALRPLAAGSDVPSQSPLENIGQHMRKVEQLLAQRQTAEPTQTEQRQIVAELDQLIDQLASQKQGQSQQQAKTDRKTEPNGQRATGPEAAKDSTAGTQQAGPANNSADAVQHVMGEVWGHLPERYRRHVQNVGDVEFLPQYRKLIEDYYRRLSEEHNERRTP